jgi:uroporphyrinogen decarboxylase
MKENENCKEHFFINKNFPILKNDVILRVIKGEKTEYTPVWIMRQAGRYLPEFKELKKNKDFFSVCKDPFLCCELTLQPIKRFSLDAAIIFNDILVIPQSMGMNIEMKSGEGPIFIEPLHIPEDIKKLKEPNIKDDLSYVFDAITLTRHKLEGKVPLIGFSGAPWTLMAYMIEGKGSKTFSKAKKWLYLYPEDSHKLLKKLTNIIIEYIKRQIEAGAQIVQLFDSWAGELSYDIFETFSLPYLRQIAEEIKTFSDIPFIIFAKGANYALKNLSKLKFDVISLDWTIDPLIAKQIIQTNSPKIICLQGNLDPCVLYAGEKIIYNEVKKMIQKFGTQYYIANLGHGLHPEHLPEQVEAFINAVHSISKEINNSKQ